MLAAERGRERRQSRLVRRSHPTLELGLDARLVPIGVREAEAPAFELQPESEGVEHLVEAFSQGERRALDVIISDRASARA